MPKNKKESLLFTTIMCFLMVAGMSSYNLLLHHSFSLLNFTRGVVPGFIVAFILDVFVVGILAKKIVFNFNFIDKSTLSKTVFAISFSMVLGMVTCMSLFGILMQNGLSSISFLQYGTAWCFNFIAALPLQLLIVGPVSRYILKHYIQN